MSKVFRARFVAALRKQGVEDKVLFKKLIERNWVVYCKQPFFGPSQVIEYLGRYTHKIAISNHRIKSIDNESVIFTAKDYRNGGRIALVKLTDQEFIRRFALHILPKGFTRIRHYGILSSSLKKAIIPLLQNEPGTIILKDRKPIKHRICFYCGQASLVTIMVYKPRGPPSSHFMQIKALINIHKPNIT